MHFVIAGRVKCPEFVYASMIAQRLSERLPKFTYSKIAKMPGDWEKWLLKTCKENEWYHLKSPIIWREVSMTKGKKHLIGDVTKFLDMCQDYYGLTRPMLTGEIMDKQEMEWFKQRSESDYKEEVKMQAKAHLSYRCRQVCILGAGNQACDVLVMELLHLPQQNREHGMEIRLYDIPRRMRKLQAMATDAKHCLGYSGLGSCRVATNMKEALYNVDLVIVMDSFPRRSDESLVKWLKRNRNAMCVLGLALNQYARTHCRVIIGGPSNQPLCYNANVLASFATKLHVRNIVVVTHDLGRECLKLLAKKTRVNLEDLYCPPVWGFIGLNKYVDLRNTLFNYEYKVPGPRIRVQIPQGSVESEIRTVGPLLKNETINEIAMSVLNHKNECVPRLGRLPQLCKVTAILDLLRFWSLKQQDGDGEILSLGVYSDGTFNIPEGLYWSQPVTLEKGFWKPYARYPVPKGVEINLQSFFLLGLASLRQTNVNIRKQRDCKRKFPEKKVTKFDLETIRQGIKIPVVRTKWECLRALKQLAKDELGLDFEAKSSLSLITEESDTTIETVPQEQIYCECWRQELLQLRKMASDGSSTTEMEVDLSENISGSEWSVINPSEPYRESSPTGIKFPEQEKVSALSETCSSAVVCDCLEDCHCLDSHEPESEEYTKEADVTQSVTGFYHKDSDSFVINEIANIQEGGKKTISFDPMLGSCDEKLKENWKFYGAKDAIVDEKRLRQMRKRMRRDEEEEPAAESEGSDQAEGSLDTGDFDYASNKFHISIDGQYEIIGDDEGLEALEQIQKFGLKDSQESFTEMWQDEVKPALKVLSVGSDTGSTDVSQSETEQQADEAEGQNTKSATEESVEVCVEDGIPTVSAEGPSRPPRYLEAIPEADESGLDSEEGSVIKAEDPKAEPEPKRKLQGIPKCCLCHCILPEGEVGCYCGETRVVEVFKTNSIELVPECEEQQAQMESPAPESALSTSSSRATRSASVQKVVEEEGEEEKEEEEEEEYEKVEERRPPPKKKRDIFALPPETFFPFSPKSENKFLPSKRPEEMKGKITDRLPQEYLTMLYDTRERMTNESIEKDMEDQTQLKKLTYGFELDNELDEYQKFSQTSFGKLLKVEDWKTTLWNKYQEWFKTADVQDYLYYDVAVEEVSDEEFESDEELKKYFEN